MQLMKLGLQSMSRGLVRVGIKNSSITQNQIICRPCPLVTYDSVRSISSTQILQRADRGKSSKRNENLKSVEPVKTVDEILKNIDTTLTPDQREHVDKLRKQIHGANSPRCE